MPKTKHKESGLLKYIIIIAIGAYGFTQIPLGKATLPGCITEPEAMVASWYGPGFHGRRAADGSIYNMHELTAAHKKLPFGTKLILEGLNGNLVEVTITDRGPYIAGRDLDLSHAAAKQLGMLARNMPGAVKFKICYSYQPTQ